MEIGLWHSYRGEERRALEKTVDAFNTRHADIRVRPQAIGYGAYLDKLGAAIPRGHGPDIFIAVHDRIGGWADAGLIAPLDAHLEPGLRDRFLGKTVDPLVYRRELYGLPTAFKSAVLYYNRALVPGPPADTDELIAIARSLSGRTNPAGQKVYGLVYEHTEGYYHAAWLFGFQGQIFDARGELTLDREENVAALRFTTRLIHELGAVPGSVDTIKVTTFFNDGRAAMAINGPWFRGDIDASVDYGVAVLPEISQSGLRARPFLGTEAFLLSARSKHPQEAVRVMSFLTRDEAARVRLTEGFQPVANAGVYDDPEVRTDPVFGTLWEQLKHSVPMRNDPEMRMVWTPLQHALEAAHAGNLTPEQALSEAQHEAASTIAAYRRGSTLKEAGAGEGEFVRALLWGLGGGLLILLVILALFFRRITRMLREAWQQRSAYAYAGPALVATLVLVFIPFVTGLGLGFFRYYQGEYFFVGAENFTDILSSREYPVTDPFSFYYKLFITILWTAGNVTIHLAIGLGLALLLKNPLLKLKGLYRVLLIIPWAIPNYITAIIWRGMFDADDGVINHLLGIQGFSWWGSTWSAFLANLVTNCWLGFPFMMVVSLGALQAIPQGLYEAADVDGASRWHKFRHITLPLLKPALFPAVILGTIWTFNMFNIIYLVSRGAPGGGTDILVVEAFRWAFERGDRYGYAAAYATLIFGILFAYTLMTNRITRATEGAFD